MSICIECLKPMEGMRQVPESVSPFYDLVPKDPVENLRWRHWLYRDAARDRGLQRALSYAAANDVLFFFGAFCWLFEPRRMAHVAPFVPWVHQEPAILTMDRCLGKRSVKMKKSRGEGATWSYLCVLLRRWLYDDYFSAGLMTRNEALVDSPVDPDALLFKLNWQIRQWPRWFAPAPWPEGPYRRHLNDHTIQNLDKSATIVGWSATKESGVGGRKTVVVFDEFGLFPSPDDVAALNSISQTTDSLFLVSSFYRAAGAYYDCLQEEDNAALVELLWWENPAKNRNLYRVKEGRAVAVDPADQPEVDRYREVGKELVERLARRGFQPEGHRCSPWYDGECSKPRMTPRHVAQQLDCNPQGVSSQCFYLPLLERMEREQARPPVARGTFGYDEDRCRFKGFYPREDGELKLWFRPGVGGEVPFGRYTVGCDIATGLGGDESSASTACILNQGTGEQVGEFSSTRIRPADFGRLVVALCRWFYGAFLAWDAMGPTGGTFKEEVVDRVGYGDVYRHKSGLELVRKETLKAGCLLPNDEAKYRAFSAMASAWDDLKFLPRSEAMLKECREYEFDGSTGKIIHKAAARTEVGANVGKLHGDLVIAAALAWRACEDRPLVEGETAEEEREAPAWSMAWWGEQHAQEGERGQNALDNVGDKVFSNIGVVRW